MKKYCAFCERKFGIKYNFCPECGRTLEIISKVDLKKSLVPYLKDTGFTLEELRDGSYRFGWFRGDDIYKDSQKVMRRFIKNKPDFLTLTFNIYKGFDELEFTIYLEAKDAAFGGFLYLPVNKTNIDLVLCLSNKEDVIKLVDKCQEEISLREEHIKEMTVVLKKFKDLKKRLSKEDK